MSASQTVVAESTSDGIIEAKAEDKLKENVAKRDKYGVMLSKFFYIALWPLLVVAGFAMDNSMVYGGTFGFDTALWYLRNLIKNIANFAL
jgi:hypothetical protein